MMQGVQAGTADHGPMRIETPEVHAPADRFVEVEQEEAPARWPSLVIAGLLIALALAWIVTLAWSVAAAAPLESLTPLRLIAWIGLGSAPLALIAGVAILLLRSGRGEALAYGRASARLRDDADLLAATLARLNAGIAAARRSLGDHAGALESLGVNAGERIARAATGLAEQTDALGRTAGRLDDATALARADLGVLLADLPQAEALASALGGRLRESGLAAEQRARTLEEVVARLDAAASAAALTGADGIDLLDAKLRAAEGTADATHRRIAETALRLDDIVEHALAAAAAGAEDTRAAVADRSAALVAIVDQARASLTSSGDDAARALAARLDALSDRVDALGSGLEARESEAGALLDRIETAVATVEQRFAALAATGTAHAAQLADHTTMLAGNADAVARTLDGGAQVAEALLGRMAQLRQQADAGHATIADAIPAALARVRLHAEHSLQAITAAGQRGEGLSETAAAIAARLAEAETALVAQRHLLDEVDTLSGQRLAALHDQASALAELLTRADAQVHTLSEGASGALVEALLRVRDTAAQAGDQARDAISAAIPRAAQRLGESAARAMAATVAEVGRTEIAAVGAASEQAIEAARHAAERLTRQLLVIAETSTAIDARIDANRADTEAHDEEAFARSVGLLIEALNSTAIDLVRLLASDVGDTDWEAYLRGDRGIFTRRAARLLDRGEAAAIAGRFNDDAEFRALVSRYVHDFEAMLRRVMAAREATGIATTLLSSDAGKLYVALAQAIERLRR